MEFNESITTFIGWCAVINVSLILFMVVIAGIFHEGIGNINAKLFGVSKEAAKTILLQIFFQYRIAVLVLNVVPYIALKIMS